MKVEENKAWTSSQFSATFLKSRGSQGPFSQPYYLAMLEFVGVVYGVSHYPLQIGRYTLLPIEIRGLLLAAETISVEVWASLESIILISDLQVSLSNNRLLVL